ncbi:MAG: hypothetical protein KC636_06675 [Myxococcales bacterium]|nr:hypothetical protein [Myxococcales bacterium]
MAWIIDVPMATMMIPALNLLTVGLIAWGLRADRSTSARRLVILGLVGAVFTGWLTNL